MPVLTLDVPAEHNLARRGGRPLALRLPGDKAAARVWSTLPSPMTTLDPGHGRIPALQLGARNRQALAFPGGIGWPEVLPRHLAGLVQKATEGELAPKRLRALPRGRAGVVVKGGDTILCAPRTLDLTARVLASVGWTITGRRAVEATPTLHLAPWHRVRDHGPGALLSTMCHTPRWAAERADGEAAEIRPAPGMERAIKHGRVGEYLADYGAALNGQSLKPGTLYYHRRADRGACIVQSGDTLCCNCDSSKWPCVLGVLAGALVTAGWRVSLYGHLVECRDGCTVYASSGEQLMGRLGRAA